MTTSKTGHDEFVQECLDDPYCCSELPRAEMLMGRASFGFVLLPVIGFLAVVCSMVFVPSLL